jgi:hypothetical protein
MRSALFLLCAIAPLQGSFAQPPDKPATPPVVTRPTQTFNLRKMGVFQPSRTESDEQLTGKYGRGGFETILLDFDPNMHVADVHGEVAILYRQERQGMQAVLRIFRVDLQAQKSISISLPFQMARAIMPGIQGNASVERVQGDMLLVRTNNCLALIDESDLSVKASVEHPPNGDEPLINIIVMPAGDQFVEHRRSEKKEIFIWLSLPSFTELRRQSIDYDPYHVWTVAGPNFILRGEADGIRSYPADSASFLACADQLCNAGTFLGANRFLLHGQSGLALLDVGKNPSDTRLQPLANFTDQPAVWIGNISGDRSAVAVTTEGWIHLKGMATPNGVNLTDVYNLIARNLEWRIRFRSLPGWWEAFLAAGHRSVWIWQDNATLSVYEAPQPK